MSQDHFVAQTYLMPWCDPANRDHMHAYRKSNLEQFRCRPYDVCRERDGDTIPNYIKDPKALGEFRSIFEPRWKVAIEGLRNRCSDPANKFVIAGYWANLTATTPSHRRIGNDLFERELRSIVPTITRDKPLPEDFKFTIEIDPNYIRALSTRVLLRAAWQLYNQPWTLIENHTACPFLTSDNPSVVFPAPKLGMPTIRVLPLTPTLCVTTIMDLLITPPKDLNLGHLTAPPRGGIKYGKADKAAAMMINRATVLNAEDIVFSRYATDGVASLVEKYRDYHQQLHHAIVKMPSDGVLTQASIRIGKKKRG